MKILKMNYLEKGLLLCIIALMLIYLCGCSPAVQTKELESGVNDAAYEGIPNPVLDKNLMLSEEEQRDGVKKITIKCGVQIDLPTDDEDGESDEGEENDDGEERVRPKI